MDTIWEAYMEDLDWEGYTKSRMSLSFHRTKDGAEKVIDEQKKQFPRLRGWKTREIKLED